jgi:predicted P-loop ATPase
VFVGTTNEHEFLADSTGNRRFWVIPMTKPLNRNLLHQERDLIWAAAVTLYRQGELWHLNEEEEALMEEGREQYRTLDPWQDRITERIEFMKEVTTNWILEEVLKIEPGSCDRAKHRRVSAILRALGRKPLSNPVWRDGRKMRIWVKEEPKN